MGAASLLLLPLAGLVIGVPWHRMGAELSSPAAQEALRLSLVTSTLAAFASVVLGVPLAWVQARVRYPGRGLVGALTTLPMVLPPVVGGVALLLVFGRRGLAGPLLDRGLSISLPYTMAGAVMAQTFVSMPFLVLTVEAALRGGDRAGEDAARTLGAGPWRVFWRVTMPALRPALGAGAVLAWARALGEFGATMTFAGNLEGVTRTVPLFVFVSLERGDTDAAVALSLTLVALSVGVLAVVGRWWPRHRGGWRFSGGPS